MCEELWDIFRSITEPCRLQISGKIQWRLWSGKPCSKCTIVEEGRHITGKKCFFVNTDHKKKQHSQPPPRACFEVIVAYISCMACILRPITRGAKSPLEKNSHPLEKCVGHHLKLGSVYFTSDILAATYWLQLLCHQSKIRSHGMTQYQEKGHFVKKTPSCSWSNGFVIRLLYQWFSVRLSPCRLSFVVCFFFAFFQAPLRCYI